MSSDATELRVRRETLLRRSATQRLQWQSDLRQVDGVLAGVDRAVNRVHRAATRPVLLAGGVLVTLLLGRSRSKSLLRGGLALAGQLVRRFR